MSRKRVGRRVLLSFVGTKDQPDGAVLTVVREKRFHGVHLLWNPSERIDFFKIAQYVRGQILAGGYCEQVEIHRFNCKDVTDHNEIYPKLLSFCKSLGSPESAKFTGAIASGTPAMQVCWILLAESGDFPIDLVRSNEPEFGRPLVVPIRLGTALPRIIRIENENKELREEIENLIPEVVVNVRAGSVTIGKTEIALSPVEFSYYRYFAEKARRRESPDRWGIVQTSALFVARVHDYHEESFPESSLFRQDLRRLKAENEGLDMGTFRGNVSKANTKIRRALGNGSIAKFFTISSQGKRHALSYGIALPGEKIHVSGT